MRRRAFAYGLAAVSLALLAWIVRAHLGELERLSEVSPLGVVGIAALFLLGRGLGGVLTRIGLTALGYEVRLSICVMLTLLASYTNLALPRTGIAPGAVYLHVRHGVPYASYLSFAVASLLIATSLVGTAGLALSSWLDASSSADASPETTLLFAAIAALAGAGVVAPARLFALLPARLRTALAAAHDAWLRLARRPAVLAKIVSVQIVTIFVRGLKVKLAFATAGVDVPLAQALMASICADVGMLISITPAALGFREGGLLFGAALIGVAPGAALLAAVVDRLATTAVTLVAGQLVLWRGLRGFWREAVASGDPATVGDEIAPR